MDAENTHPVFDWLWSSGQLSERDIDQLPALGIEAVINLALPTSPGALADEADRVTRLGIAYVQIPVLWEDPKPEQFHQFAAILAGFRGRKVWVHCAKNMRASAFIHLYRRRVLGHTEAEAGFPMREVWSPDETWSAFIERVLLEHNSSPQSHGPEDSACEGRRPRGGGRCRWASAVSGKGKPCGGSENIRVKAGDSPTAALLVLAFAQHPSDLLLGQGGGPEPLFGRPRI